MRRVIVGNYGGCTGLFSECFVCVNFGAEYLCMELTRSFFFDKFVRGRKQINYVQRIITHSEMVGPREDFISVSPFEFNYLKLN